VAIVGWERNKKLSLIRLESGIAVMNAASANPNNQGPLYPPPALSSPSGASPSLANQQSLDGHVDPDAISVAGTHSNPKELRSLNGDDEGTGTIVSTRDEVDVEEVNESERRVGGSQFGALVSSVLGDGSGNFSSILKRSE
jgi:hypothetical protein